MGSFGGGCERKIASCRTWGNSSAKQWKNKRSPCPHKTSNTLQANNLLKINLEWALSYEWEFYEFVLFLSAEWMEKHGWINKWGGKNRKKCENTLFFSFLFLYIWWIVFDRLLFCVALAMRDSPHHKSHIFYSLFKWNSFRLSKCMQSLVLLIAEHHTCMNAVCPWIAKEKLKKMYK